MPTLRFSPLRAALAALLAIAQPAMGTLGHCPPLPAASASACEHAPQKHTDHAPGPERPHHHSNCVSCCCVPSGVLASTPVDAAALLGPVTVEHAAAPRVAERIRNPLPHLHPFATAPPVVA